MVHIYELRANLDDTLIETRVFPSALPDGEFVSAPDSGRPYLVKLEGAMAAGAYAPFAEKAVDSAAESARLNFITPGAGQAIVYERKAQEAERITNDPSPVIESYPLLASEIDVSVPASDDPAEDLRQAGAFVANQRQLWLEIAGEIEKTRLAAKQAIRSAVTVAEIGAILAALEWPASA